MSQRDNSAATGGEPAPRSRGDQDEPGQASALLHRIALVGSSREDELFEVALRGYSRRQVEQRVSQLTEAAETERQRADGLEVVLQTALRRLEEAQEAAPPDPEGGFGVSVEKMLRLAEHEASEIRKRASSESTALLEQARTDAESRRHEVEESLVSRAATLDQEAARRTAVLNERDRELAVKLAAAGEEAEKIRSVAEHDAKQERAKAERWARDHTARAEHDAQEHREAAAQEIERIVEVHDGLCLELAKWHRILGHELGLGPKTQLTSAPDEGATTTKSTSS